VEKAASHATTLPAAVRRREVTRLIVDNFGSAIKEHRILRRTCPEAIFDPPLRGSTSPAVPAMPGTTAEGHQSVSSAVAARFIRVEIANLIPAVQAAGSVFNQTGATASGMKSSSRR
jgi:hypothetical protein